MPNEKTSYEILKYKIEKGTSFKKKEEAIDISLSREEINEINEKIGSRPLEGDESPKVITISLNRELLKHAILNILDEKNDGDTNTIKFLLKEGPAFTMPEVLGIFNRLINEEKKINIVKVLNPLLEKYPSLLNEKDGYQHTPLEIALKKCDVITEMWGGIYPREPSSDSIKIFSFLFSHSIKNDIKIDFEKLKKSYHGGSKKSVELFHEIDKCQIEVNGERKYLLYFAVEKNHAAAIKFFFDLISKEDIPSNFFEYQDKSNGDTLLHHAARNGNIKIYKMLIKLGASDKILNNEKKTALEILAAALPKDTDKETLNEKDEKGDTLLHDVARNGNIQIYKMLLKLGAADNIRNGQKKTALEILATALPKRTDEEILNEQDEKGDTLLHRAAIDRNIEAYKKLKEIGASDNIPNGDDKTAKEILVEKLNEKDTEKGNTLLHRAAIAKSIGEYNKLKELGASQFIPNKDNKTALQLLKEALPKSAIAILNKQDEKTGDTALHLAASNGNIAEYKHLKELGASESIRNKDNKTALEILEEKTIKLENPPTGKSRKSDSKALKENKDDPESGKKPITPTPTKSWLKPKMGSLKGRSSSDPEAFSEDDQSASIVTPESQPKLADHKHTTPDTPPAEKTEKTVPSFTQRPVAKLLLFLCYTIGATALCVTTMQPIVLIGAVLTGLLLLLAMAKLSQTSTPLASTNGMGNPKLPNSPLPNGKPGPSP